MDRITAMQVFMDVAETSSFTLSAQRLGMSWAMVTRCIATLEQWLDSRLFHCTTRKVSLTSAGERCILQCEELLKRCASMEADSKPLKGEIKGHLRIAARVSFSHAVLMAHVKRFLSQHPLVSIELDCGDRKIDNDKFDTFTQLYRNSNAALRDPKKVLKRFKKILQSDISLFGVYRLSMNAI